MVTLARLGRVQRGSYTLDTPGDPLHLGENGLVSVENVPSFRQQRDVVVDIEGIGPVTGDVAWGGNWFFIVDDHGMELATTDLEVLREYALQIRRGLEAAAIHGVHEDPGTGERTYHVIATSNCSTAGPSDCDSRNFVLCPGASDLHVGTGLSAARASRSGMLGNGQPWAKNRSSAVGSSAGTGTGRRRRGADHHRRPGSPGTASCTWIRRIRSSGSCVHMQTANRGGLMIKEDWIGVMPAILTPSTTGCDRPGIHAEHARQWSRPAAPDWSRDPRGGGVLEPDEKRAIWQDSPRSSTDEHR